MKRFNFYLGSVLAFALPVLVSAQGIADGQVSGTTNTLGALLNNIIVFTNNVLIPFILAIGFFVFVWGMFQYFIVGGSNEEAKEKGKSFMVYAILGFLMIFIFWGVINILGSFTGLQGENLDPTLVPFANPTF